jgi:hypothetical protein
MLIQPIYKLLKAVVGSYSLIQNIDMKYQQCLED